MCILWYLELRKNVCANLYYDAKAYFNKSCSCCEACKIGSKEKQDERERKGIGLDVGFFMHCSYYNWLIVDGLRIILDFLLNIINYVRRKKYLQIVQIQSNNQFFY